MSLMGRGVEMKSDTTPMRLVDLMNAAPRCTATSKRSGKRCKAPAVRGWSVCRMHGAGGGHKSGAMHPTWQHGGRSSGAVRERREVNEMLREFRKTVTLI